VTRGPGHVRLDFSGETAQSAERFAEQALPPGVIDREHSQVIGIGAGAPRTAPTEEGAQRAATELSAGEASWKRRLAPQHRSAVRSFFGGDPP